jgi:uncharacterized protein YjbJ (UPF0337 family)
LNQVKEKKKSKYGSLANNELTYIKRKLNKMMGILQQKTGRDKAEIGKKIKNW